MAKFEPALQLVIRHEGDQFVNDKHDAGGASKWGISLRFYKQKIKVDAAAEDIRNLTYSDAADIYERFFWDTQPYSEIISQNIADKVFDLSVNCGYAHANGMLQKAVNTCSGAHLVIDGQLGIKSIKAINTTPEKALYDALILQAEHYYIEVAKHGDNQRFYQGWINRLRA